MHLFVNPIYQIRLLNYTACFPRVAQIVLQTLSHLPS